MLGRRKMTDDIMSTNAMTFGSELSSVQDRTGEDIRASFCRCGHCASSARARLELEGVPSDPISICPEQIAERDLPMYALFASCLPSIVRCCVLLWNCSRMSEWHDDLLYALSASLVHRLLK